MLAAFEMGVGGEERRKEQRHMVLSAGQLTYGGGEISVEEDGLLHLVGVAVKDSDRSCAWGGNAQPVQHGGI